MNDLFSMEDSRLANMVFFIRNHYMARKPSGRGRFVAHRMIFF